jgi:hypothetical protein
LEEDQKKVFGDLEKLFGGVGGWKDIASPYQGVKMGVKHGQKKTNERSITLVQAEGMADCTAEEGKWY